jgi:hypothetical protein
MDLPTPQKAQQRARLPWSGSRRQGGGVVLEYLLITLFTAMASITLLGVAAHIFREKIQRFAHEAGIELHGIKWNPFGSNSSDSEDR